MNEKDNNAVTGVMEDSEIVDLYWARNERAIEETDRKYHRYLFSLAYNILRDDMDCEECLNDTYLGTWNSIPPSKPTWLGAFVAKIMRNHALNRYRRERADKRIPSEMVIALDEINECFSTTPSEEESFHIRRVSEILNTYLQTLNDRQEYVFVCRYYCSDSVAKIAQMLGVSDRTVFRDLTEVREGLKKRLQEAGYYDEK